MVQKSILKKCIWFANLIFFNCIFLFMHYLKFSVLLPVNNYLYLYTIFLFFWIIFTLYYNKVDILIEKSTYLSIRVIFWSSLLSLLFVVIVLSFSDLWSVSRLYVISFVTLLVVKYWSS